MTMLAGRSRSDPGRTQPHCPVSEIFVQGVSGDSGGDFVDNATSRPKLTGIETEIARDGQHFMWL